MDNNQDKYTNYRYNKEGSNNMNDNYYNQPQNSYNQPYNQPQNNYNPYYNQPQNNYNQPPYNQPTYTQNPYYGQPQGYGYGPEYTYPRPTNQHAIVDGFCISSLICGIMSIPLGFCYGVGLIFSIIAIIMRNVYRKRHDYKDHGLSKGGLITGIIGIVTSVLFYILLIFIVIIAILSEAA